MTKVTPKYFHYFLSCLLLDCIFISGSLFLCAELNNLWILLILWIGANLINYPRKAERRYISYYKLLLLSFNQVVTFFAMFGIAYVLDFFDKIDIQTGDILVIPIIFLSRIVFAAIIKLYRIKGYGFNRFYLIGGNERMMNLKKSLLSKKSHGFLFEGVSDTIEDFSEIESVIVSRKLNEIHCLSSAVSHEDLAELLSLSFKHGVDIHVVTNDQLSSIDPSNQLFFDFLENNSKNYALADKKNLLVKRIFDILFSSLVTILILSWVTIILGILIKLGSRGPVFYVQPRAGRNGKYFNCFKFRSMKTKSGNIPATENDPRVTKIGQFIRKTSIDELPQFVNVLLGQMSVVGPRPHIKNLNDQYDSTVNDYNHRLLVKPGITGLSQTRGHRGEIKDGRAMKNRINLDLLYIKNWSILLDVRIIYKTVVNLLFNNDENAY